MENFKNLKIQDYAGDLSKRWYVQFLYRNPDTLKFDVFREWISLQHKTKTARYVAAKELRDNLYKKLLQGFNPYSQKAVQVPIKKALENLIEIKAQVLRKRTWHSYSSIAQNFCAWLKSAGYDQLMPHQLTKHMAQCYMDQCLTNKKMTARTYNNQLMSLRTLFSELENREAVEYNVFKKIKPLHIQEPSVMAYSPMEIYSIKEELEQSFPELWLCACFVYYGFIRPQELCRLQLHDLDFINKTITVPGSKSKNKKTETILMPDPLYNELLKLNYHTLPAHLLIFSAGKSLKPGEREISPNRIFNQWQIFVQNKLGIKKGIYLLKHTGAGQLFDSGADIRSIQQQLRHATLEQTLTYLKRYSKVPNSALRAHFKTVELTRIVPLQIA